MEKKPTDPPPERSTNWVDVLLVSVVALMALTLVVNLVDFGRLVMGGGHC